MEKRKTLGGLARLAAGLAGVGLAGLMALGSAGCNTQNLEKPEISRSYDSEKDIYNILERIAERKPDGFVSHSYGNEKVYYDKTLQIDRSSFFEECFVKSGKGVLINLFENGNLGVVNVGINEGIEFRYIPSGKAKKTGIGIRLVRKEGTNRLLTYTEENEKWIRREYDPEEAKKGTYLNAISERLASKEEIKRNSDLIKKIKANFP